MATTNNPTAASVVDTEFKIKNGKYVNHYPVKLILTKSRIEFPGLPFSLKDTIKQMAGAKWHGYDEKPRQLWSIRMCPRNVFRLRQLQGEPVFAWWDRPLEDHTDSMRKEIFDHLCSKTRELMPAQVDMINQMLTYHYLIIGAEMSLGKTLAAIETIRIVNPLEVVWVCPASLIASTKREFARWGAPIENVHFVSYDSLNNLIVSRAWDETNVPQMLFIDEATHCKNHDSARARALQKLADFIREKWGYDGYVFPLSGTPSPKRPTDIWSLAEITCPGYIREGSAAQLEKTLAVMVEGQVDGGTFKRRAAWKTGPHVCSQCGDPETSPKHDMFANPEDAHPFLPCANEVEKFAKRLSGLVRKYFKKDWLPDLPDFIEEREYCEPSKSLLAAAKTITSQDLTAIKVMSTLRQLSDGFMYRMEGTGTMETCKGCAGSGKVKTYDHIGGTTGEEDCCRCSGSGEVEKEQRVAKRIPCPKDDLLRADLERCWDRGRIVVAAPHRATVERCRDICLQEGWQVVQLDGSGMQHIISTGKTGENGLEVWENCEQPVAFVANIESVAMGFNLQKANVLVVYSNSFKPHYRTQLLARIHRPGSEDTCYVRDYLHLPSDERALEIVKENRKLELMTLGEILKGTDLV